MSPPAPTRPVSNPPTPVAAATGEHLGQHKHCRACGTNLRGEPPPTPIPRPAAEVLAVNGRPLRGHAVEAIAAQARQAITKEDT